MNPTLADRLLAGFARLTSTLAPWHKWPFLIALPTLAGLRVIMRERNLFDTETAPPKLTPPDDRVTDHRAADGSFNALDLPWMGMAGARFGRNVPINETFGAAPRRSTSPTRAASATSSSPGASSPPCPISMFWSRAGSSSWSTTG